MVECCFFKAHEILANYMFNFIPVRGWVQRGSSKLFCLRAYNALKTACVCMHYAPDKGLYS